MDVHRNAVLGDKRWHSGQIPYVINSSFSSEIHGKIITAMREIEHDVNNPSGSACIKFVPRTTQTNYIDVYPGTGCHSTVGMADKGRQTVSLGQGCDAKGIMMHELIHSIGFWHEQSRSDRNSYVTINLTNVEADNHHDYTILSTTTSNNQNVAYDFGSIMHYGPYEFSIDRSIPTVTPKSGLAHSLKMGQRLALSKSDVLKIQRLYGCTEDTTHITTPLTAGNLLAECSFESSICTLHSDTAADFEWVRRSGPSSAGPKVGNTNGADPYLVATASGHHGVARVVSPTFNKGGVCIDLYVYQPGPSSYLNVVVSGPQVPQNTNKSYRNSIYKQWHHSRTYVDISVNTAFQVTLEAHISAGDVAIDDLHIYHGQCE
ncbi:unnamed protein product [Candidula unifasciata]|uniref:Metalloendopeptidase n=1 Tax=Candidula unifasciata TaxID=100452 RepID=A0A8S3ZB88_9EUPU|nr:unnamed protein product [Candidula unifasciata]